MNANPSSINELLLDGLTKSQSDAVKSSARKMLIVAGAGSGKTEVMARRIAWWVGVERVPKNKIVAFTFTERAAEEMKFRIRSWINKITPADSETSLGEMYVGTIHGFCLAKLREFWPNDYHNYDILDEAARYALVLRGFNGLLALGDLQSARSGRRFSTLDDFLQAYDQLNEHGVLDVQLASDAPPFELGEIEREWCKKAKLLTDVGTTVEAQAFSISVARYYAYQRCRRFLDFSTSQGEFIRRLSKDGSLLESIAHAKLHLVVDEVQDINPIQRQLMDAITGDQGKVTAVGDHRQAIYGFRGAKVEIIGDIWNAFRKSDESEVVALGENFRSTPRIIDLANRWARTISALGAMTTPPMLHGNTQREDNHSSHVALLGFKGREEEAKWISDAIRALVPSPADGALHDKKDGSHRGLTLSDVAVLVRSSTDVRMYMRALESAGIDCVVRAGPDLFSQPEVLFFLAAIAISADNDEFVGSEFNPKSMPKRISSVLGCGPNAEDVLRAAASALRSTGLIF